MVLKETKVYRHKLDGGSKISAILKYFHCMIGNTADAWSHCSSRSDSGMLQVWFSCRLFVQSEHGIKIADPLEDCSKDKQCAVVRLLCSGGVKGAKINQ
jgi:hypothetical protein